MITYTMEEWMEEGKRRFGGNIKKWKFVCPKCKTVQTPQNLIDLGIKVETLDCYIGFCCIGCFDKKMKCDCTLNNSFHTNEAMIIMEDGRHRPVFQFEDE